MFYKIARTICRFFITVIFLPKYEGLENADIEGGYIVCPNHKSNLDPVIAGVVQKRQLKFLAKEELFSFKPFGKLISSLGAYPIKRNQADIGAIKAAMALLKEGHPLVIFPQGMRSKTIELSQGKQGAAMLAIKMKVPVLPMGISGRYIPFSRPVIRLGKPIYFEEYYGKKLNSEDLSAATDKIMTEIIHLAK